MQHMHSEKSPLTKHLMCLIFNMYDKYLGVKINLLENKKEA